MTTNNVYNVRVTLDQALAFINPNEPQERVTKPDSSFAYASSLVVRLLESTSFYEAFQDISLQGNEVHATFHAEILPWRKAKKALDNVLSYAFKKETGVRNYGVVESISDSEIQRKVDHLKVLDIIHAEKIEESADSGSGDFWEQEYAQWAKGQRE